MKHTVGIVSLGCPRNLVDSEKLLSRLAHKGCRVTDIDKAETALLNTCAFIQDAKQESVDAVLDLIELKKLGTLKRIIVYGCLVQRYGRELADLLPEVDAFVGSPSLNHDCHPLSPACRLTPAHYAYLKISEGCRNACSYCIIPRIKGPVRSLGAQEAVSRARELERQGVRELNIIGQDITSYGSDIGGGEKLVPLVRLLLKETRIPWIRLLYLYPGRVSRQLLSLMKNEERICKYIDLPLQHCNNRILKLMGRPFAKDDMRRLIDTIRDTIPGVTIRTTFIVGFPSETEREFEELLDFVGSVRFERLGAFAYSREEGTRACAFKGNIPGKVKSRRLDRLMKLQQEIARAVNEKFLGTELEVLVEEKEGDAWRGRSRFDAPEVDGEVLFKRTRAMKAGDLVRATVIDTLDYDLVAEVRA